VGAGEFRAEEKRVKWRLSNRNDVRALPLADRHYNRQKIGAPGFVPPGRCLVLLTEDETALWVTSWPRKEYVQHAWAGAWVNSLFRKESNAVASELILEAIAATRSIWPAPDLGIISFVDPRKVPGVTMHGRRVFGYCYQRAGFEHVGFTKGGLWAWQLLPKRMPRPQQIPILQESES
jgi:hypothetical protein